MQSRLSLRGAHCQWEVAQRGPGAEQVQRGAEQVQSWLRGGSEGLRGGSEPEGCRAVVQRGSEVAQSLRGAEQVQSSGGCSAGSLAEGSRAGSEGCRAGSESLALSGRGAHDRFKLVVEPPSWLRHAIRPDVHGTGSADSVATPCSSLNATSRRSTVGPPGGRELGPLRPQRERRAGHFNQWRLDPPAPGRVSVPPSARVGARVAPLPTRSCPPTAA